jgi:hypothetical protein
MTEVRARLMRFIVPAAVAGAIAGAYLVYTAPRAAPSGPNTLPDRIADSTFWRMFTTMSEPGGSFRSDNFVSNETQLQYVIPRLQKDIAPGGVYVGVGPEQNFTYIVGLAPKIAFIVDIRRQNAMEHLMYKALIELSADRAEFLSRLYSRPLVKGPYAQDNIGKMVQAYVDEKADTLLFARNFNDISEQLRTTHGFALSVDDLASLEYVYHAFYLSGPDLTYSSGRGGGRGGANWGPMLGPGYGGGLAPQGPPNRRGRGGFGGGMPSFAVLASEDDGTGVQRGFLASDSNFRALKEFESRNLLVPIVGDFAGPKALRAVGAYSRDHNATIDVFYTSNVEQYLWQQGDDWDRFYKNVATLPITSASTFIRSASGPNWYRGPNRRDRMAQLTLPIGELLKQLHDGHVQSYRELLGLSH